MLLGMGGGTSGFVGWFSGRYCGPNLWPGAFNYSTVKPYFSANLIAYILTYIASGIGFLNNSFNSGSTAISFELSYIYAPKNHIIRSENSLTDYKFKC